jgi:hypothetical protein
LATSLIGLQLLTQHKPFSNIRNDLAVIFHVQSGGRPKRENQIKDEIWHMLEKCWNADPKLRPSMADLANFFRSQLTPPPT